MDDDLQISLTRFPSAGVDFSKIMGDPEIMAAMQNPKMMQVFCVSIESM